MAQKKAAKAKKVVKAPLEEQNLKAVIAQGNKGDFAYDVEFKDMQLVIQAGDAKLGIANQLTVSAELVVAALFAALPKGTLATGAQQLVLAGLKLVK